MNHFDIMSNTTLTLDFLKLHYLRDKSLDLIRSENTSNLYAMKNKTWFNLNYDNGDINKYEKTSAEFDLKRLRHVFSIGEHQDLLLATAPQGVRMFLCQDRDVLNVNSGEHFLASEWKEGESEMVFGRFYFDVSKMGAVLIQTGFKVKFFEIKAVNENYNFHEIATDAKIFDKFCPNMTEISSVNVIKGPKEELVGRYESGFCVFEFGASSILRFVRKIDIELKANDKIFFANLSGQDFWMDLIVFNSSGMFVFEYWQKSTKSYDLLNYNPMFSEEYGWTDAHTETLRFVDIDDDGFDDLVFTGPGGIEILSFDLYVNKWKSLLNTGGLSVRERHSIVLNVVTYVQEALRNMAFLTFHSGSHYFATVVEKPAEMLIMAPIHGKFPLVVNRTAIIPEIGRKADAESRSIVYLRDLKLWFGNWESINPQTGRPIFILPLVAGLDSMVKFNLFYDGSSNINESLGLGWSTEQNFIALNYQSGNFKEDYRYTIVIDNIPYELTPVSTNATEYELFSYKLQAENNTRSVESGYQAKYYPATNMWCLENEKQNHKKYYGSVQGEFGAVVKDTAWRYWRGLGFDEAIMEEWANMWYLEVSEIAGVISFYEYEIVKNEVPGRNFSSNAEVYLKSIANPSSDITFSYSKNFLLSSYTYKTKTTEQTVHLKYTAVDNINLLTSIEQESDYIFQPVVQFKYCEPKKGNQALERIILPTGTEVIYSYTLVGEPVPLDGGSSRSIEVFGDYNINYGPGFVLISYMDTNSKQICLRMFNDEMSEELYPSSQSQWPSIGRDVEAYEMLMGDSFFAVVTYTSLTKTICLFGRGERNSWTTEICSDHSDESEMLKGTYYVLVSDPNNEDVVLIQWSVFDYKWETLRFPFGDGYRRAVAVFGTKFLVYNDTAITLAYKNAAKSKGWLFKKLQDEPGCLSKTIETINKFDLKMDFRKALLGFFRSNAIHLSHNLIVLASLAVEGDLKFVTIIRTYVVGQNHEVVSREYNVVDQDKFSELHSGEETGLRGDIYTLKYAYEKKILQIVLGNVTLSKSPYAWLTKEIATQFNSPAQRFLLDLKNYYVSLREQTLQCRETRFVFGGVKWHRSELKENSTFTFLPIGDRFTINKTDAESSIKLYNATTKRMLFDFRVKETSKLLINYPNYIASQDGEESSATILEFIDENETSFRRTSLPKSQTFSHYSNSRYLVVHESSNQSQNKTLLFWSKFDMRRFFPNYVVDSVQLVIPGETGGSRNRITGYDYHESSADLVIDTIYYNRLIVVPGNNRQMHGYFFLTADTVEFFNGDSKLVKRIRKSSSFEPRDGNITEPPIKDSILYSRFGSFDIAIFSPFPINSDMNGFIGFEDYERWIFDKSWTFNRTDIIREQFSLTGKNYLHLERTAMKGKFRPDYQDQQFLASCWIRTSVEELPIPGDTVPYLTASVLSSEKKEILNFMADVKYQIGDWSYLEVVVDLKFTGLVLTTANQTASKYFEIEIRVSPFPNKPIDVDHVRFSPLDKIFEVNVYDDETNNLIAVIKQNGAITRKVYDKYRVQIAEINESNKIEKFITYTKGSYVVDQYPNNPPCEVTIDPENGFYDDFSPMSFRTHWQITLGNNTWQIAPSSLQHRTSTKSQMLLKSMDIDWKSYGVRFLYSLETGSSINICDCVGIRFDKAYVTLMDGKSTKRPIPAEGEILFVIQRPRVFVWIDGGLYIDQYSSCSETLIFFIKGEVKLQHLMVFERPGVKVTYKNALNEKIQQISLRSSTSAVVRQLLYDELGRQRITLLPFEVHQVGKDFLMAYDAGVVTNDNPDLTDSVWKTGTMKGGVGRVFGHNYPFAETVYDKSPLNVRVRIGLPGREFSAYGLYGRKFKLIPSNLFLRTMYPLEKSFTYEVQIGNDEDEKVVVFDDRNRKVASYIHVKNGADSFSSFEYDKRDLMTKCRSPMYYLKFGIFDKTSFDLTGISQEIPEKHPLEIHIEYDGKGNLRRKFGPDTGPIENIYNDDDQIRFIIQYLRDSPESIEFVTYFLYDTLGRLSSTGGLKNLPENREWLKFNVTEENADEFQRFYFSATDRDPALRGKILRTVTTNQEEALFEESIFESNLISKRYIIPSGSTDPVMWSIKKEFEGGLLKKIVYPASMFGEVFQVTYEYDKLGRMVFVEIPGQLNRILLITYDASNRVANEFFHPLNNPKLQRTYRYNAPGYLIEVNDPFLKEEISYTDKAYGRKGYGDGTITRVKFTAKWHELANINGRGVHSDSFKSNVITSMQAEQCYRELKEKGYLNEDNQQTRIFYQNLDPLLSLACTKNGMERRVKEVLGRLGFPREYGFRLDYGKYMELRKAKYFVGNLSQEQEAFQQDSFMRNIDSIDREQSQEIWNLLKTGGYIVEDGESNVMFGKSIVRASLVDDLKSANPEFANYAPLVTKLLIRQFTLRQSEIALPVLEQIFDPDFPNKTAYATAIREILSNQEYLQNPFDEHFVNNFVGFHSILPEIVDVMERNLGVDRTEFDVDINEVDLNGNLIRFQTGFDKYSLQYEPDSNRISYVLHSSSLDGSKEESRFKVRHDSRGNVVQALHLNIHSMEYHPVSNRLLKVHMSSGTTVSLDYDSKGERFRKRVANAEGRIKYEIDYLRDENGRTLVERNVTYMAENQDPDILVTMYIYGPKSLVGFVRRDQFYNVFVDHQGSTRLVVRNGEVVAAYDYLPYGKLMRSYESTPLTRISYLYTGQEWDPETGLYNYHARFYDPSIGRFYQIDPMSQYFSPYKYAGNSPISMIDPSGSIGVLFMLAIFGFAVLCAYVEGAKSNQDYNILNWKWNLKTYIALMKGAVVGALIPIGFKASVGVLVALKLHSIAAASLTTSIGVSISYMKIGASSTEWNPKNWDYTSPKTLSDALVGFSAGVNIFSLKSASYARIIRLLNHAKFALSRAEDSNSQENFEKPGFRLSSIQTFDFPVDFPIFNSEYDFKQNNGGKSLLDFPNMEHKNLKIINDPHSAVLIENLNLLFRDTYYNFVSVGILRSGSLDSINLTISRLTGGVAVATPPDHLQHTILAKTLDIANEIANVLRNSGSEGGVPGFAVSNQIVSLQLQNVTLIYPGNLFINPLFFITNNGKIGSRPITQETNPALIQMVANAIVNVKEMLFKSNKQNFFKWKIMKEHFVQRLDDDSVSKCEKILETLFEANHTYISRDIIIATMKSLNFTNQDSRTLKRKYLNQEKKLNSTQKKLSRKSLNFTEKFELEKKVQFLEIFIKNLKVRERVSNVHQIDNLADIIWKVLKKQQISLLYWPISDHEDPPSTMFPYSRPSSVLFVPNPSEYDSTQDVISQGSELTAFKKCYTCIKTPPFRGTQIQDFVWLTLLNENFGHKLAITRAKEIGKKPKVKRRSTDAVNEKIETKKSEKENSTAKESSFFRKVLRKFQDAMFDNSRSNFSSPNLCNESCSKSSGNLTEFGDEFLSQIATNETLFLAGLFAAKCGQKKLYKSAQAQQPGKLVYHQTQVFACEVIELLENSVRISADVAGIADDLLDMSEYPEIYQKVIRSAMARKFEDILNLLMESAMSVLPPFNEDQPNDLNLQKRKKFEQYLNRFNLKSKFDAILVKMNGLTEN